MSAFKQYRGLLGVPSFRWFWTGFAVSALGDAMSYVALIWTVFELSHSAQTLALFSLAYTGPVIVGGFMAGWLLDRFDRRTVMLLDSAFRGCVVGTIPVFAALGWLALWQLFVVAAVYGFLKMVTLAGAPSVFPAIVPEERLDTANSMESLAWTITGVLGPAMAGLLLPIIGAPNVLALDALSYFVFALGLANVPPMPPERHPEDRRVGYGDAFRLFRGSRLLLATTFMFMAFNVGQGLSFVWLPLVVSDVLHAGPAVYGLVLGALAAGEVVGSLLAGGSRLPLTTGARIASAQILSGLAVALILLQLNGVGVALGMFLLGVFSAPLTIWAQTLRMRIIPAHLRGRSFALLRTLMQGATPIGGGLGGIVIPLVGIPVTIALSALAITTPGVLGLGVLELRTSDTAARAPSPGTVS